MRCAGVRGMVLAGFPDFMQKKSSRLIDATMKIESQAAFFPARGRDQCAELGCKEHVLAFLGAKGDHPGDGVFREFGDRCAVSTAAGRVLGGFAGPSFRHVGGDCTPNGFNRKEKWKCGELPGGDSLAAPRIRTDLKVGHYKSKKAAQSRPYKPAEGSSRAPSEAHMTSGPLSSGRYFWSASLRPMFRLSKFRSVFRTRE